MRLLGEVTMMPSKSTQLNDQELHAIELLAEIALVILMRSNKYGKVIKDEL